FLYLLENATNVVVAIALHPSLGIRGIALSMSIAYTVAAIAGILVLRSWLGPLGTSRTWAPLRRVVLASILMGIFIAVISNISASDSGIGLVLRVGVSAILGIGLYVVISSISARRSIRSHERRPASRTPMHAAAGRLGSARRGNSGPGRRSGPRSGHSGR
ncbi:MAG: hypothetical protein M1121_07035, partial [Actinobacteria bacterium]|nr:hypothetical protein [Actinomycetota bacterium]